MMPAATAARKPFTSKTYRPRIQPISATEYLVPSERYGGYVLYKVTVQPGAAAASCECTAGVHGRPCKHSRLVLAFHAYRQHPTHLRALRPAASAEGLMELFA